MDPFGIFLCILLGIMSVLVLGALAAEFVSCFREDMRRERARERGGSRREDESLMQ